MMDCWIVGLLGWQGWSKVRVGQAFLKMDVAAPEDGRTPPKGGSEAFPYWSRRFPTCVAGDGGTWATMGTRRRVRDD